MDKKELLNEIANLQMKYHCSKLCVEIKDCFTATAGAVKIDEFEAIIHVDDDMIVEKYDMLSYSEFFASLRETVGKRKRNVFDVSFYKKIARDVIDWGVDGKCFQYHEDGLVVNVEWNSGWWESYVTNEDWQEVETNFDADHFEAILEMMKSEKEDGDMVSRETYRRLSSQFRLTA